MRIYFLMLFVFVPVISENDTCQMMEMVLSKIDINTETRLLETQCMSFRYVINRLVDICEKVKEQLDISRNVQFEMDDLLQDSPIKIVLPTVSQKRVINNTCLADVFNTLSNQTAIVYEVCLENDKADIKYTPFMENFIEKCYDKQENDSAFNFEEFFNDTYFVNVNQTWLSELYVLKLKEIKNITETTAKVSAMCKANFKYCNFINKWSYFILDPRDMEDVSKIVDDSLNSEVMHIRNLIYCFNGTDKIKYSSAKDDTDVRKCISNFQTGACWSSPPDSCFDNESSEKNSFEDGFTRTTSELSIEKSTSWMIEFTKPSSTTFSRSELETTESTTGPTLNRLDSCQMMEMVLSEIDINTETRFLKTQCNGTMSFRYVINRLENICEKGKEQPSIYTNVPLEMDDLLEDSPIKIVLPTVLQKRVINNTCFADVFNTLSNQTAIVYEACLENDKADIKPTQFMKDVIEKCYDKQENDPAINFEQFFKDTYFGDEFDRQLSELYVLKLKEITNITETTAKLSAMCKANFKYCNFINEWWYFLDPRDMEDVSKIVNDSLNSQVMYIRNVIYCFNGTDKIKYSSAKDDTDVRKCISNFQTGACWSSPPDSCFDNESSEKNSFEDGFTRTTSELSIEESTSRMIEFTKPSSTTLSRSELETTESTTGPTLNRAEDLYCPAKMYFELKWNGTLLDTNTTKELCLNGEGKQVTRSIANGKSIELVADHEEICLKIINITNTNQSVLEDLRNRRNATDNIVDSYDNFIVKLSNEASGDTSINYSSILVSAACPFIDNISEMAVLKIQNIDYQVIAVCEILIPSDYLYKVSNRSKSKVITKFFDYNKLFDEENTYHISTVHINMSVSENFDRPILFLCRPNLYRQHCAYWDGDQQKFGHWSSISINIHQNNSSLQCKNVNISDHNYTIYIVVSFLVVVGFVAGIVAFILIKRKRKTIKRSIPLDELEPMNENHTNNTNNNTETIVQCEQN